MDVKVEGEMMEIVYVTQDYAQIKKVADALEVRKDNRKLTHIPVENLKLLVLLGQIHLTSATIYFLLEQDVSVVYMNHMGTISGMLQPFSAGNVVLKIAQYRHFSDANYRIAYAKDQIQNKLMNQRLLLEGYLKNCRHQQRKAILQNSIKQLRQIEGQLPKAATLSDVMGYEGAGARCYFSGFGSLIRGFPFEKRVKRPAYDPVNALLNYTYAFLRNEVMLKLCVYGFEPELGFLHGIRYGRSSLALDVMEVFRPIFADRFVITLLNRKVLQERHFVTEDTGCRLSDEGVRLFCEHYEKMVTGKSKNGQNWRLKFEQDIRKLRANLLKGGK